MPNVYVVDDVLIESILVFAADVEAQRTYAARLEADNTAAESRYQVQAEERSASPRTLEERHNALTRSVGELENTLVRAEARTAELDDKFAQAATDYAHLRALVFKGLDETRAATLIRTGAWAQLSEVLGPVKVAA